jgi:polyphenol oxidase
MKTVSSSLLSPFSNLTALFTTRHGGVSHSPYHSANLAFHVGDHPSDVIRNHDLLAASVGYERTKLVHMRQIHSDTIVVVDSTHHFESPPECDALITDKRNVPLMVMSADCTGIVIYDPKRHVIGAVHAGRQGALEAILPKTINAMRDTYGCDVDDLLIVLGPSIGGCCYEVNGSIAAECDAKGYSNALRREGERLFLDVNAILLQQLEELEIAHHHIEVIEHCTSCRHEEYFSYRAEGQKTGRLAGVILLR